MLWPLFTSHCAVTSYLPSQARLFLCFFFEAEGYQYFNQFINLSLTFFTVSLTWTHSKCAELCPQTNTVWIELHLDLKMIVLHWLPSKMSNITRYHCAKLLIHFILIVPAHLRPEGCFCGLRLQTGPPGYRFFSCRISSFEKWTYFQKFIGRYVMRSWLQRQLWDPGK